MGNILKAIGGFLTGPASGLISAGANLLGSALGNSAGLKQQQLANEGNMRLAQYKYEKDLEQWKRETDYNSPKNQMQRFADAGLNPNLIYGQGSSGNASSAPTFDAPHLEAYRNFGDMGASGAVSAFQNAQALTAQTALMESQRAKNFAEVKGIELGNVIKNLDAASKEWKLGLDKKYGDEGMRASLQASWKKIHLMDSQEQLNLANAGVANANENLIYKKIDTEIARADLTRAQKVEVFARVSKISAELPLIAEQVELTKSRTNESRESVIVRHLVAKGLVPKNKQEWTKAHWQTFLIVHGIVTDWIGAFTGASGAAAKFLL
ncbi:DNA pilot protein [Dipodfec virus UOA04_Rod_931]|nr:DNA pilot protein [Dipodfec virus UOA04_Rod_931]